MKDKFIHTFKIDSKDEIQLKMSKGVFVPTGTSTILFKAIRKYINKAGKTLDLGCGCGVIGIALYKIGLVKPPLYASDLSEKAISCLKHNTHNFKFPIIAKCGSLFEPWKNEKFDYIIDDVSGVAQEVAGVSPWFKNVPCQAGVDGTSLVVEVIKQAPAYLNMGGLLFFPIVSFSNVETILAVAQKNFLYVKRLAHEEWPLPKEMQPHLATLERLKKKGHIQFMEKFGMVLWFTDIYVAYNS